ncbi:MAG: sugar ABC transporter permease [Chloroflexi bacterium]|nr:sugar ABC transporter permease [Chloroflexota bacterium]
MATSQSAQVARRTPGSAVYAGRSTRVRSIRELVTGLLFLLPSLIIFFFFVFVPLIQNFQLSTYATDPIGRPSLYVGLKQYQELFADSDFANSLGVSLQFALLTVPTTLVISLFLAELGNLRLRGITIFRTIFSSTIAISGATAALVFLYLYNPATGPLDYFLQLMGLPPVQWLTSTATALPAVSLTTVWLQMGLNTIILLAGMQGISDEFYESAKIDGAAPWSTFRHITLPLLSPTIFFLLVVDTLAALQAFTQFQVMTLGGPVESTNVVVYSIYRQFYFNGNYGYAAAQAGVLFFIMLILTIIQFGVIERRVFYQ